MCYPGTEGDTCDPRQLLGMFLASIMELPDGIVARTIHYYILGISLCGDISSLHVTLSMTRTHRRQSIMHVCPALGRVVDNKHGV